MPVRIMLPPYTYLPMSTGNATRATVEA
jgi:hypothetical protein